MTSTSAVAGDDAISACVRRVEELVDRTMTTPIKSDECIEFLATYVIIDGKRLICGENISLQVVEVLSRCPLLKPKQYFSRLGVSAVSEAHYIEWFRRLNQDTQDKHSKDLFFECIGSVAYEAAKIIWGYVNKGIFSVELFTHPAMTHPDNMDDLVTFFSNFEPGRYDFSSAYISKEEIVSILVNIPQPLCKTLLMHVFPAKFICRLYFATEQKDVREAIISVLLCHRSVPAKILPAVVERISHGHIHDEDVAPHEQIRSFFMRSDINPELRFRFSMSIGTTMCVTCLDIVEETFPDGLTRIRDCGAGSFEAAIYRSDRDRSRVLAMLGWFDVDSSLDARLDGAKIQRLE